jgi:hypothetical protein
VPPGQFVGGAASLACVFYARERQVLFVAEIIYGHTVLAYSELGSMTLVGWHSPSERAMPIVSFAQHQSKAS